MNMITIAQKKGEPLHSSALPELTSCSYSNAMAVRAPAPYLLFCLIDKTRQCAKHYINVTQCTTSRKEISINKTIKQSHSFCLHWLSGSHQYKPFATKHPKIIDGGVEEVVLPSQPRIFLANSQTANCIPRHTPIGHRDG